jgi:hypothetical protein
VGQGSEGFVSEKTGRKSHDRVPLKDSFLLEAYLMTYCTLSVMWEAITLISEFLTIPLKTSDK